MTSGIDQVFVIFKTHLDLGFTDYAASVEHRYFQEFIPHAIRLARELRDQGREERFIWTTGSWLIYEFLERASATARRDMEAAIVAGDIVWHTLPFTTHTELLDPDLFRYSLSLSQRLDVRFGRKTIAAKMTDVPGHTRSIVPLLAEAGVEFLHIGVNEASTVPDVPPLFRWRDEACDSQVNVMYHANYGSDMTVHGLRTAIALTLTNDNLGPPTIATVLDYYRGLREQFPDARIVASTLDAFAQELRAVQAELPVVIAEIGDTWIHGVGTDPTKVSRYRELSRLRRTWLQTGELSADMPSYDTFSKNLLLITEHTWGLDDKTHLHNYTDYSAIAFQAARHRPEFQHMEASWKEQRAYLDAAIEALKGTPLFASVQAKLAEMTPAQPDTSAYSQPVDRSFDLDQFELAFDPSSGAIVHLRTRHDNRLWADSTHPLALVQFETFSAEDYQRFWQQYIRNQDRADVRAWATYDYTKPGIEGIARKQRFVQPMLQKLFQHQDTEQDYFLLELSLPEGCHQREGAPARMTLQVVVARRAPHLRINLQWFDKPACRLPEAFWLSFVPLQRASGAWMLEKSGGFISPLDVVSNGNRHLHAVQEIIRYTDDEALFQLHTLDAPLVAPGRPALLEMTNQQPDMRSGIHVNLYNNVWGTNFPMWFEDDARFRFELSFKPD